MVPMPDWQGLLVDQVFKDFLKKFWFMPWLLNRLFEILFELLAVADLKHSDPP